MTDDEINERLTDLLPPDQNEWLRVLVACNGYTDPAVVVGLMEQCNIGASYSDFYKTWFAGTEDVSGGITCENTLPKAVALAAIKYLEQSNG